MRCGSGHDDIDLERDQFGRESREPLDLPLGSIFNDDVAALDVTEVTQPLMEDLGRMAVTGHGRQITYSRDLGRLLGCGHDRAEEPKKDKGDAGEPQPYHLGTRRRNPRLRCFWIGPAPLCCSPRSLTLAFTCGGPSDRGEARPGVR